MISSCLFLASTKLRKSSLLWKLFLAFRSFLLEIILYLYMSVSKELIIHLTWGLGVSRFAHILHFLKQPIHLGKKTENHFEKLMK